MSKDFPKKNTEDQKRKAELIEIMVQERKRLLVKIEDHQSRIIELQRDLDKINRTIPELLGTEPAPTYQL